MRNEILKEDIENENSIKILVKFTMMNVNDQKKVKAENLVKKEKIEEE